MLNRVIRIVEDGWEYEYEPDRRHADIVVDTMCLKDTKCFSTPAQEDQSWTEETSDEEHDNKQTLRSKGSEASSLVANRPNIMRSVKEICRQIAKPTMRGWKQLKRLARYLIMHVRTVLEYPWQNTDIDMEGFQDSDWAGC